MKNLFLFLASFLLMGTLVFASELVFGGSDPDRPERIAVGIIKNYDTSTKIGVKVVSQGIEIFLPVKFNEDLWPVGSSVPLVARYYIEDIEPVKETINGKINPAWNDLFSHTVVNL